MGIRYKFERLFGRFLRGGAKIALFIDIAFGVAGTIFALWTSVRPRVDDYGNAAPSLWEQCGALEVLGGSLLVRLMGVVLAFALHMGVRYLKRLWKSSTLGRVCVAVYFMYAAYCLLMGNVILFVLSSLFEIMLAIWLLGPIVGFVGMFTGWLFGRGDPSDTATDSLDKSSTHK